MPPGTTVAVKPAGGRVIPRNDVCVLKKPMISLVQAGADLSKTRHFPSALVELDARHEVDVDAVSAIPQVRNSRPSRNNTTKPKEDEITEKVLPFQDAMVQSLP